MDIGKLVDRRLNPVRLALDVLRDQLAAGREGPVTIDRQRFSHIVETIGLFVDDFEMTFKAQRDSAARASAAPKRMPGERAEEI